MADLQAWNDRRTIISLFQGLQNSLDNYIIFAKELNKFKNDVLDDTERKTEMKKLIDEDPDWTLTKILNKYNEFKDIFDYLTQL